MRMKPNWNNQSVFIGDNIDILRAMNNTSFHKRCTGNQKYWWIKKADSSERVLDRSWVCYCSIRFGYSDWYID